MWHYKGNPMQLVTDNSPSFVSAKFEAFLATAMTQVRVKKPEIKKKGHLQYTLPPPSRWLQRELLRPANSLMVKYGMPYTYLLLITLFVRCPHTVMVSENRTVMCLLRYFHLLNCLPGPSSVTCRFVR